MRSARYHAVSTGTSRTKSTGCVPSATATATVAHSANDSSASMVCDAQRRCYKRQCGATHRTALQRTACLGPVLTQRVRCEVSAPPRRRPGQHGSVACLSIVTSRLCAFCTTGAKHSSCARWRACFHPGIAKLQSPREEINRIRVSRHAAP